MIVFHDKQDFCFQLSSPVNLVEHYLLTASFAITQASSNQERAEHIKVKLVVQRIACRDSETNSPKGPLLTERLASILLRVFPSHLLANEL
jgi:hypothetical protein